jgi:hypothetical protein
VLDSLGQVVWGFARTNAFAIGLIASLLAIGSFLLHFGRPAFLWLYRSIWIPFREVQTRIPRRTLIVQAGDRRSTLWGEGKFGNKPIMHMRVDLHLTNTAKQPVFASKALLRFRRFSAMKEGDLSVRHPDQEAWGRDYPILPGRMAEAFGIWMISPPFQKANRPAVVRVCVIDQFGNRSWSDKIRVLPVGDPGRVI